MDQKKIKTILKNFLEKHKKRLGIKKSYLFGSYAKNKAIKESDVDLLVVFEKYKGSANNTIKELYKDWNYDINLSIIPFEEKRFKKAKKTQLKKLIENSIEII